MNAPQEIINRSKVCSFINFVELMPVCVCVHVFMRPVCILHVANICSNGMACIKKISTL